MRRASKKGKLKRELDRLVQQIYIKRNPHCLVCRAPTDEMHHYVQKKQSLNLRWEEINLIPLCKGCHCRHHRSGDPRVVQTIILVKGHEWADEIERKRRIIFKDNICNLEEVKERLLNEKDI